MVRSKVSLPRFGGVEKHGIYSTEGGEYAKATENLHPGVQTGGGPAREEQWETNEPDLWNSAYMVYSK